MFSKENLESLYNQYNRRMYLHPDPLEFLYAYEEIRDREIAGFVASALAYGKVSQILKSVSRVLQVMGTSPFEFLKNASFASLQNIYRDFKHRFATAEHLSGLLFGVKRIVERYGSLYDCFLSGYQSNHDTVLQATYTFARALRIVCGKDPGHLIPLPERGSACKRMNLYLRWMIRKDNIDPGGWEGIPPAKLIIPLDIHMHRIGVLFGLTVRKQSDIRTALEITDGYKNLAPADPVKYDFALTRLGIRGDLEGM
jgi:uncharacterized protein (TIGR02757 family)